MDSTIFNRRTLLVAARCMNLGALLTCGQQANSRRRQLLHLLPRLAETSLLRRLQICISFGDPGGHYPKATRVAQTMGEDTKADGHGSAQKCPQAP